jgi:hypothetical protein
MFRIAQLLGGEDGILISVEFGGRIHPFPSLPHPITWPLCKFELQKAGC